MRNWLGALAVGLTLVACGGAYADAVARGDRYLQAEQWDEAAAAYEAAVKIDPEDPEARIKLKQVRQRQVKVRLRQAKALEDRGELSAALSLIQEAIALDDSHPQAQEMLTRLNDAVLKLARKMVSKQQLREAFELTTLVLRHSKRHAAALALDDEIRSTLAEQAFAKASVLIDKGKLGNALTELAACLTFRADFPDAKLHFGQVKLRLEQELRYLVVLEPFGADSKSAVMSKALSPELLAQAIDRRLLLTVVSKAPEATDGQAGVTVGGRFVDYAFSHTNKRLERSCDYVCGTTYKPNPQLEVLRKRVASAEQEVSRHDDHLGREEKRLADVEKDLSRRQAEADRADGEVEKARGKVDACRARDPKASCSSEESSLRSRQSSRDSVRSRVTSARRSVDQQRQALQRRRDDRRRASQRQSESRQELLKTPEKIAIDKFCPHNYAVQSHTVAGQATVMLTVDPLGDKAPILQKEPFRYSSQARDVTFPAQAGRCPEVARADPLKLPSEQALRQKMTAAAVRDVRGKIVASYDAYRRRFLVAARRYETAGAVEDATEAYVRYVLTGPHDLKERSGIARFFRRARGMEKLDALWKL